MTAFPPLAGSNYHAASVDLNRRFAHGLMFRANYTWAHTIDDATNELFSSVVNPRRAFDWMNLGLDRGRSALDIRQKFAMSWIYELPTLKNQHAALKAVANGWQFSGTYIAQTGQPVDILSNADSNANADTAADRGILNVAGAARVGTAVNYVCAGSAGVTSIASIDTGCPGGSGEVAGYVAQNPDARYIQAEVGAMPTLGRNSFGSPGMSVWNMGLLKNTKLNERINLQFRVNTFNTFNHRNFSLAQPSVFQTGSGGPIGTVNNALSTTYSNLTSSLFLDSRQFSGGSRSMQLGVKVIW